MRSILAVVVVFGCGCENAKAPLFDGPMPVRFGDCADASASFVSGPRPLPVGQVAATRGAATTLSTAFASLIGPGGPPPAPEIYGGLLGNESADSGSDSFGFGHRGSNGWGAIGNGQPGTTNTTGHGDRKRTPSPAASSTTPSVTSASGADSDSQREASPPPPTHAPEPAVNANHYTPGSTNPLAGERGALVECLRESPTHAGAIIIELEYDAGGSVAAATVHGLDDEGARSCMVATAKRLKRIAQGLAAQRCSLAFGETPVGAALGIDITNAAGTFDGKSVATAEDLFGDAPTNTIPRLRDAVEAHRKAADAPGGPVVSVRGPIVLRPIETTPMLAVMRAVHSVLDARDDFVLATRRGGSWETLPKIALPVVPVPFGTGGGWNRTKLVDPAAVADDEQPILSVLVRKENIWLGTSLTNDFVEVVRGPSHARELAKALRDIKANSIFVDRVDIEIASEWALPYADTVAVIDAAVAAGFVDWRIADPSALASRPYFGPQ